jgi:hypothetical protein
MNANTHTPRKWSDFDKYLKGEHLEGKAYTVTIRAVEIEETHPRPGQVQLAPVAYFKETKKGLVLTPTNQDALARLFGDDITGCIGKPIVIKAEQMRVAGNDRLPIRIYPANKPTVDDLTGEA